MRVIEIHPDVFTALDAQREGTAAQQGYAHIAAATSSPQWQANMSARLATVMTENSAPRTKLRKLANLLDEVAALRSPHVPCKPGCSACCHVSLSMTDLEAELIEHQTGRRARKLPPGWHVTPAEQLGTRATPCPFLMEDRCSIYAVRPISCRDMAIVGPDALACSFENMALAREKDPRVLPVQETKVPAILEAWKSLAMSRPTAIADIRQFFPYRSDLTDLVVQLAPGGKSAGPIKSATASSGVDDVPRS